MPKNVNGRRMTSKKRIEQRTLAFVNRVSAALGRKPLKRLPRGDTDSGSCPIANALGRGGYCVRVYGSDINTSNPEMTHALTKVLGPSKVSRKYGHTTIRGPKYLDDFVDLHDRENAFGLKKAA